MNCNSSKINQQRRRSSNGALMLLASAAVLTNDASAFTQPQRHKIVPTRSLLTGTSRNSFVSSFGLAMGTSTMAEGAPAVLDHPTSKIDYSKLRDKKHSSRDKTDHKDENENTPSDEEWELLIYDDRANTREKIARVLVQVTARSESEAFQIMKKADTTGVARVATSLQFEVAEAYNERLRHQGILSEIVPVSSGDNSGGSEDHEIGEWQ